ncbi:MAG TPA: acyl-CoA dehydrogenase family protein [Thermoleophilaceae bacterium]
MTVTVGAPERAGAAPAKPPPARSFTGELAAGVLRRDWLFPYPRLGEDEARRVEELTGRLREYAAEAIDPRRIEQARWIGDGLVRDLGERGLMGLGVPEAYGGAGLSMSGYCRMFESLGNVDAGLALVIGIHQSIGTRGIVEFGTAEQRERFLPDLAAGRRLAAFALTEPAAGSDAFDIRSRAVRQPDGSWRLNGGKCFIGNGEKGSVFVTFARAEVGGRDRHVALILERGMPGFECGERYDTLGLRANDVRPLHFADVRVPPENVLGEAGEGFRIARRILETGRVSISSVTVGCAKQLLDRAVAHVRARRQFGRPLGDFPIVQDKIAWIASNLAATEAMTYLTTGLEDAGELECSLEKALCKIWATEFVVGAANRALDLRGGAGYTEAEPYERILRDVRVFPIFEGSNDVLRGWIALSGIKAAVERLRDGPYAATPGAAPCGPVARRVDELEEQVAVLGERMRSWLASRGEQVRERQLDHARFADALAALYAQGAVLSRLGDVLERAGGDGGRREERIALEACARAARRCDALLDEVDGPRDDRVSEVAELVYERAAG